MTNKTGMRSMYELARKLCGLVSAFEFIILGVTNNDPKVVLALEAAKAACSQIQEAFEPYLEPQE